MLLCVFGMIFWVFYISWVIVKAAQRRNKVTTSRKNAPIWYKALVLVKPVLAMVAAIAIIGMFPSVDEYCYAAAIFGIVMIIWTALDVVRAQNRFTMRDLPLFNEKRGGEA